MLDFDETSSIIIYPTLFGIKFYNIKKDDLVRVAVKHENTERFLKLVLF